ncbi:hypothetical protein VFPPC_16648 [Pochonia chlamydosporia 170]|uniref:Uncharacterized protein n=1 Tax=Pochonia chlamydosporia 170 TaxID=1380566 RepID=A0A179FA76_METCM|nr:hypothetical protein VFPPC_16648 [Pochonia chlamydosporia 170]OAQ62364.1 hypothetical protein VFPPC_16648 [Pochonia chlamydosporia 170]
MCLIISGERASSIAKFDRSRCRVMTPHHQHWLITVGMHPTTARVGALQQRVCDSAIRYVNRREVPQHQCSWLDEGSSGSRRDCANVIQLHGNGGDCA